MNELEHSQICDKIVSKFPENQKVTWTELKNGLWEDILGYDNLVPIINKMIIDNVLQRDRNDSIDGFKLTEKGISMAAFKEMFGYERAYRKNQVSEIREKETLLYAKGALIISAVLGTVSILLTVILWLIDKGLLCH